MMSDSRTSFLSLRIDYAQRRGGVRKGQAKGKGEAGER